MATEFAALATCVAALRKVCKSIAFAPRAFPPVAVPSGGGPKINAPVPRGVSTRLIFAIPVPADSVAIWAYLADE